MGKMAAWTFSNKGSILMGWGTIIILLYNIHRILRRANGTKVGGVLGREI